MPLKFDAFDSLALEAHWPFALRSCFLSLTMSSYSKQCFLFLLFSLGGYLDLGLLFGSAVCCCCFPREHETGVEK